MPHEVGSTSRIAPLAAAAITAANMNRRHGAMRSGRPRIALTNVPQTKPTATLLASKESCLSEKVNSSLSTGMIALAENHMVNAITSHKASKPMESHLPCMAGYCGSEEPALAVDLSIWEATDMAANRWSTNQAAARRV
jgi:hypothetical protein